MAEAIVEFFRNLFGNDIITIFFVSAIPFVELRGSILLGVSQMALNPFLVWGLSWLGSTLLGVLLFFLLKPILNLLKKIKWFKRFIEKVEFIINEKAAKIARKTDDVTNTKKIDRVKTIGVAGFIAIPLPLTGTWTGTAIAVFLGMKFKHTMLAVAIGNFIASTIIFLLSIFFTAYIDYILYGLAALIIIVVVIYVVKMLKKPSVETTTPDKEGEDK